MRLDIPARDGIALELAGIVCETADLLRGFDCAATAHRLKVDGSPTTQADLAAERLILERLRQRFPDIPAVAEETANAALPGDLFFLVDPLDGTRDFLHGSGEYSVNIALVAAGRRSRPRWRPRRCAGSGSRARPPAASRPPGSRHRGMGRDDGAPRARSTASWRWSAAAKATRRPKPACRRCPSARAARRRRPQILPHRVGRGRCLCALRPDHGVGHGGGRPHPDLRRGAVVKAGGGALTYGHHERGYLNGPFAAIGDASLAPRLHLPALAA
jgi:3'(2'), 5'-bisphosphate nucleotidase